MSSQISKSSNDKAWSLLQTEIKKCFKCRLHTQGIFPIFGDGSIKAKVVFIGEAPGLMENKLKKPFVGRSGQILNDYLSKINLSRDTVFITNVIKCRPPENRDPMLDEITACTPYLSKQINLLNAKIIVPLGRFAARFFLMILLAWLTLQEKLSTRMKSIIFFQCITLLLVYITLKNIILCSIVIFGHLRNF